MFGLSQLSFFIGATLALLLVPGPAVLYIVARSIHQNRLAGVISVLGIQTGSLFHILAAAFGLSAILLSSALAFNIVKYLGAAYLIYLGLRKILSREIDPKPDLLYAAEPLWKIYFQGLIVNLLNPKTALFFFAFLPQFINTAHGNAAVQIFLLGSLFMGLATITDGAYALLASALSQRLKENRHFLSKQRYFSGLVYIGLGVSTAFTGANKK
jgi:threonine/homoserine/homoserine lactone efflux protein